MKLWHRLKSVVYERHAPCAWCNVRVEFTGEPARSPLEATILELAKGRQRFPFHWLEEQLATALYDEELRRGAWTSDIGVWGPAIFRREASNILRELRPEFGLFKVEGEISHEARQPEPCLSGWSERLNQL